MTLELLLQIIKEKKAEFDNDTSGPYCYDCYIGSDKFAEVLQEILEEYEKRNKMEWINELHEFVSKDKDKK